MGRADLDTTLTFGRGGIEHADGIGRIHLTADGGRPSAVVGRFALPVSGGGPLEVRDGQLLFQGVTFATAGGARIRVDGGLHLGTWEPDLQLEIASDDLAEVERLADNFYPAIQNEPLTPPLNLGGAGRIAAHLSRSFSDPRVEGRLYASDFVLRGVPFGTASAEFLVDRNVATFSPFTATDGGASLSLTGKLGWGGALKGEYRLDGLVAEFSAWPIERVLKFLDIDLPITGAGTGRLPLDGVTPALSGRIPLVLTDATLWGQKLDRLEGVLAFEKDRIVVENATARLADGTATGGGFYRYADRAYGLDLDVRAIPVARLDAAGGLALTGTLSGRVKGSGTVGQAEPRRLGDRRGRRVERESARAPGHRARAPGDGRPRRFHSSGARSRSGRDHAPTRRDGRAMARPSRGVLPRAVRGAAGPARGRPPRRAALRRGVALGRE